MSGTRDQVQAGPVRRTRMQLSVSTASELGSSCRLAISVTLLLWVFQSGLSSGPPPPPLPPGLGLETRRLQEAQASSSVSYPLCCSEAQKLGPEVIMKMENVVWPHDSASLTCLFAGSALHTLPPPPPVWRRLKKLNLQSVEKKPKRVSLHQRHRLGRRETLGLILLSALVPPQ